MHALANPRRLARLWLRCGRTKRSGGL